MMFKFVSTAVHEGGLVTTSAPNATFEQLDAIEVSEMAFEMVHHIRTLQLYRVDPVTAELVHVQTWTRSEVTM